MCASPSLFELFQLPGNKLEIRYFCLHKQHHILLRFSCETSPPLCMVWPSFFLTPAITPTLKGMSPPTCLWEIYPSYTFHPSTLPHPRPPENKKQEQLNTIRSNWLQNSSVSLNTIMLDGWGERRTWWQESINLGDSYRCSLARVCRVKVPLTLTENNPGIAL